MSSPFPSRQLYQRGGPFQQQQHRQRRGGPGAAPPPAEGGGGRRDDGEAAADAAAAAAAYISATVGSFTSPKLGSLSMDGVGRGGRGGSYSATTSEDPSDWLNRQVDDDDDDDDYMDDDDGYGDYYKTNRARGEDGRGGGSGGMMDVEGGDEDDDQGDFEGGNDERLPSSLLMTPSSTRKNGRPAALQRADTPVMSNASSEKKKKKKHGDGEGDDGGEPHRGSFQQVASPAALLPSTTSAAFRSSSHADRRRYHDALLRYTLALRRGADAGNNVEEEETGRLRAERDFLDSLRRACWDRAAAASSGSSGSEGGGGSSSPLPSWKEGNFWMLLSDLRSIGADALLWDDDDETASSTHHNRQLRSYVGELSRRVDATPRVLVDATKAADTGSGADAAIPEVLVRRRAIQRWLGSCFDPQVSPGATRPRQIGPSTWLAELENGNARGSKAGATDDREEELFGDCLSLLLAGRWDEALQLLWKSGLPGRAAAWGGGEPQGFDGAPSSENDDAASSAAASTGNPRRALWRRMMWLHSQALAKDPALKNTNQAAIVALLSCDLFNALDHPALRSWEHGLFASIHCILGRMEDELLHMHNVQRSSPAVAGPPYPGTNLAAKESDHLKATADVAALDERGAVTLLMTSPFEEMLCTGCGVTMATASALVGRTQLLAYLEGTLNRLEQGLDLGQGLDDRTLCFVLHLILYLDSVVCDAPSLLPPTWHGVDTRTVLSEWKNQTLVAYLYSYLAKREDLWFCLVLYASHLPEDAMLRQLPQLLSRIENPQERMVVIRQLHEHFPEKGGTALEVLTRIVKGVLADEFESSVAPFQRQDDRNTPTKTDTRKMTSIMWLSFDEEYWPDAASLCNALLRQFLLADKFASASLFVEDFIPESISAKIEELFAGSADSDDDDGVLKKLQVCSEHQAYRSYLKAVSTVRNWKTVLASTDTNPAVVDDQIDTSNLNEVEAQIATRAERRELVKEKSKLSFAVVKAAKDAHSSIKKVLCHDGGWLVTEDEENAEDKMEEEGVAGGPDAEATQRRDEMEALRRKLLPKVVMMSSDVCLETAAWMYASLNDAAERLDCTWQSALSTLDGDGTGTNPASLESSPLFPAFWTRLGLDLAQLVASDTYSIKSACGQEEFKRLLGKLEDATVADLLYSCVGNNNASGQ